MNTLVYTKEQIVGQNKEDKKTTLDKLTQVYKTGKPIIYKFY